ncbi:probable jasmonic acid carboxyl methyltransferase 2 [Euphorbia lathyris]|uniref:probable jasmonic acid carboxyl methyltransferase 2 n=1 Tax=Euphorbia lathyris TaxID=212925 RepID=UPI003313BFD1
MHHMNKGDGETSYAKNSSLQNKIISVSKEVTEEAVIKMFENHIKTPTIGIADLGCSSGPNTLTLISEVLNIIHTKCQHFGKNSTPVFNVFLNDLPSNDFNTVFKLLPDFYTKLEEEKGKNFGPCFINATPGSFYGRLFAKKSIHCLCSSSSLHWISKAPPGLDNKGKIYISKSSPASVLKAYSDQFQNDFSEFLRLRSEELVGGGCMVLSFIGRSSLDPTSDHSCYQWELLANALMSMVSEGLIEEEKVDNFDAPYYAPCVEEIKTEVEKEGSFMIHTIEAFEIDWDGDKDNNTNNSPGQKVAKTIRAVVEGMLEAHFGSEIMDDLFLRYSKLVDHYLSNNNTKYFNFVISMFRNPQT